MRFLSGLLTAAAVAAVVIGGMALGAKQMFEADGPLEAPTLFEVPDGSGLASIAQRLEAEGVISSQTLFRAAAIVLDVEDKLQAADYEFAAGASMRDVLDKIATGDGVDYSITIRPGDTVADAVAAIEAATFLEGEVTRVPAEGMLAPETHFFQRGAQRQDVVDFFVAEQQELLDALWADRAEGLPFETPEEALIVASIVEKETALIDEYPLVASVFINRIDRGERLDADSTLIYGIVQRDGRFGGNITRADLRDADNPWNTRALRGLPPTPIANPGSAALAATLQPADTNYMFFVADGTGGHAFAETLSEHNANVERWIEIERELQSSD